jgi:CheY-like chemotaxis protein
MKDYSSKLNNMINTSLKGFKILIVEDDFSSRLYLNKILEKAGAILLNAGDGEEAIEIAHSNPDIELILMDIQLPVMDGYLATEKIREFRNDIIIIAQTAYGLLGEMEKISAAGFNDYIIKPILSKVLIEKMLVNLERRKT